MPGNLGRLPNALGRMASPAGRLAINLGIMANDLGRIASPAGRFTNDLGRLANDRPDLAKYQLFMIFLAIFSQLDGASVPASHLCPALTCQTRLVGSLAPSRR
jgi:hypothetical protein